MNTASDFRADLHCHTNCSDGSLTPLEIVKVAVELGLKGLAITDHDSIQAYVEAIPEAKKVGLELVSGVEFSAMHQAASVHILGYSFALDHPAIIEFCFKHKQRREGRNQAILERLAANGMPVSHEEMLECTSGSASTVGRPHIAQAMIKKGYVSSLPEAFKMYLGEGKPCYARGVSYSAEETIAVIHQAKGFAVIAHPHLIKEQRLVEQLVNLNFDGLEGYYALFYPSQNERWLKMAKRKGWMVTGGSDFHGAIKPAIPLGASWIGEETFGLLQNRYKQNLVDDQREH